MRTPRLSRALILEREERVPDGSGGHARSWAVIATHWADVTAGTGRRTPFGEAVLSRVPYTVVIRGLPVGHVARPRAGDRFRSQNRIWKIEAVGDRDLHGAYATCHAVEEALL